MQKKMERRVRLKREKKGFEEEVTLEDDGGVGGTLGDEDIVIDGCARDTRTVRGTWRLRRPDWT